MMDDMISRQAAIDTLENTKTAISENGERYIAKQNAIMRIDALPSAEPEQRTGKWIKTARWRNVYKCDQCGNYLDFSGVNAGRGDANFCPNCGAKMEVTE